MLCPYPSTKDSATFECKGTSYQETNQIYFFPPLPNQISQLRFLTQDFLPITKCKEDPTQETNQSSHFSLSMIKTYDRNMSFVMDIWDILPCDFAI